MRVDADRYMLVVYQGRPVHQQKKLGNDISVTFYDGSQITVSTSNWMTHKKAVFVPKNLGPRNVVAKDWAKYSSMCK
jgi:hypothetical protein